MSSHEEKVEAPANQVPEEKVEGAVNQPSEENGKEEGKQKKPGVMACDIKGVACRNKRYLFLFLAFVALVFIFGGRSAQGGELDRDTLKVKAKIK